MAALECAEQGIQVNAVCPGWIETPMVMERGVQAGEDPTPLARTQRVGGYVARCAGTGVGPSLIGSATAREENA